MFSHSGTHVWVKKPIVIPIYVQLSTYLDLCLGSISGAVSIPWLLTSLWCPYYSGHKHTAHWRPWATCRYCPLRFDSCPCQSHSVPQWGQILSALHCMENLAIDFHMWCNAVRYSTVLPKVHLHIFEWDPLLLLWLDTLWFPGDEERWDQKPWWQCCHPGPSSFKLVAAYAF